MIKNKSIYYLFITVGAILLLIITSYTPWAVSGSKFNSETYNIDLLWLPVLSPGYFLGTDGFARDMLAVLIVSMRNNIILGVFAATGGIFAVYIINFIMSFFGSGIPIMNPTNGSIFSIGFSLFVVIIASFNLVLDFDFIEEGSEKGAPKYMEWYGAFGLLITLIWLYLEILRLLAKLQSRR